MNEPQHHGEEFRAGIISRKEQRRPLPADTLRRLTELDPLRSTASVAATAIVLAIAISAAMASWTPAVVLPAMLVIATRQHACFVLAHEAAHYRMYESRWLNDAVGRACAMVAGVSMCSYRVVHRLHHNHLYGAQDPDIALHGGYPRGKAYLVRKLLRDLAGLTAHKTYAYFFGNPAINTERARGGEAAADNDGEAAADNDGEAAAANRPLNDTSPALRKAARNDRWLVVAFHLGAPIVAFAGGYLVEYLVLWLLPLVTVVQAMLRLRAICEHGAVTDTSSPLTAARTNLAPWWSRWLLFPHHVNYHIEHHLYPAIPHYKLPACHAELRRLGYLGEAEVRSLSDTLKRVFAPRRALAAVQLKAP